MRKVILLSTFCILLQVSFALSQTNYQWRNTERSGIYNETNLLKLWPDNGPELIWEKENIGNGYGAPVFTQKRMYILGEIDGMGYIYAFDLKGKLIWKKKFGKEWVKSYPGSRSTPTIVDGLMYVSSGMGNIYCFTTEGELKWSKKFIEDFSGQYPLFGHSESLLVNDNKVFFTPGGKEKNVVALNRFSGEIIWECKALGERSGYNSPNIISLPNRNILVTFSAYALLGIDMKTGELLWSHLQDNIPVSKRKPGTGDTHSNTIIYKDGFIYYVAGDGNCAVKLELSENGSKIKQVWRNKQFDNYMGGNVLIGNYIYGSGTAKKHLISVDITTGQISNFLNVGSGTLIAADDLLYYYNQKGQVNLIKPTDGKMELLSTFKITKGTREHFAHPVINKGILYIRHGKALMAFNIKQN